MLNTRTLKLTLMACTIAAVTGTALAQQTPPAPAAPTTATTPTVRPGDLLTPQERDAFRKQLQQAATPEERQKLRDAQRATVEQRAREKGVTLAQPHEGRGHGGRAQGGGPRGDGPYSQLFTQAERDQFRDRMHGAQTVEERMKVRDELHALAETRAKEKGITLPSPGQGRHGHGPGRAPAPTTTPPAAS